MRRFAGCCRFVWNKALALEKETYEQDGKRHGYNNLAGLLRDWKKAEDTTFLADAHSQILQQSLKDLDRAYVNFFQKRAGYPRFKKRGEQDSFRYPQGFKLDEPNSRIFLPKIGWIRYRKSRDTEGVAKNVTVSLSAGKWYVSIQTEFEQEIPTPKGGEVGIDMGIVRFATLSDGTYFEPINAFKTLRGKLAKLQKQFKNKTKFSKNWQKLKAKIGKLHHKISNIRKNHLHQISSAISKNHAIVYVEDLKVSNMSKSAKGTAEKHGKNVAAKSGLNRAILDQAWSEFRRQLDYKLLWNGGHLIAVPPQNTSRCCPACGHTSKDNRQTQENFECVECNYQNNADVVGAINVLKHGRELLVVQ